MSTGFIPRNLVDEEAEELPTAPPLPQSVAAVSYTHLTLPTILRV